MKMGVKTLICLLLGLLVGLVSSKRERFLISKALLPQRAARNHCRSASRILSKIDRKAVKFLRDGNTPMVWTRGVKLGNGRLPKGLVFLFADDRDSDLCCRETQGRRECNRELCHRLAPALCRK